MKTPKYWPCKHIGEDVIYHPQFYWRENTSAVPDSINKCPICNAQRPKQSKGKVK